MLKVFYFFLSLSVLPDFPLMNLGQWTLQVGSCHQGVLRWRWGKGGEGRLQVPQARWAGGGALSLGLPRIPPSLSTEPLSPARAWYPGNKSQEPHFQNQTVFPELQAALPAQWGAPGLLAQSCPFCMFPGDWCHTVVPPLCCRGKSSERDRRWACLVPSLRGLRGPPAPTQHPVHHHPEPFYPRPSSLALCNQHVVGRSTLYPSS